MKMTREHFVARYRHRWAAMILFMQASEVKEGPLARGARIYDMPAEVDALLGQMWDENKPETTPPAAVAHGKPAAPAAQLPVRTDDARTQNTARAASPGGPAAR